MTTTILGLLLGLVLIGVPVGFALMLTAAITMEIAGMNLLTFPIQLYSGTNKIILLAIPLFILMGELMGVTSISQRLIDLAAALVGWIRGGLSHINIVTSMFMAEMSGSAVADAAVMSKVFVPQMERRGYPKGFAAAVTAVSATLGIIIPPSIPMVLYGVTTNTSIKDLFLAGIVPGLILGGAFMVVAYIFAVKQDHPRELRFEPAKLGHAFKRALIPLLIPVLVVGGLIVGIYTPTEAAAIGVFIALFFGAAISRDLTFRILFDVLVNTARQTAVVMMIVAGSAVLGQVLANEQIPQKIAESLGGLADNFVIAVLMMNLFLLALGMFLHASAAIIVVVPLLMPLSAQIGIDPVHFGVIVCLNLGIGQQTPPVASVLLTVCSTTGLKIEQVMTYAKWFILAMFCVLMFVTFSPWTALWFR